MRPIIQLSVVVAIFAAACFALSPFSTEPTLPLLATAAAGCAIVTFRARNVSTFLRIFIATFATELVLIGSAYLLNVFDRWPAALEDYQITESLPLTLAVFAILIYGVSFIPVIRRITRIADGYFESPDVRPARVWPLPPFVASDRRIAAAMIVILVVINQIEVGISVRLSFFNRDWFNAIQNKDEKAFWSLLYSVFAFWAAIFVTAAIIEYVIKSTLIVRWRQWLSAHYINRWLDGTTHYKMSLSGSAADNPDQRIAEDVNRFIDGGDSGYGIYSYSILLISTVSSLVSFSIILWKLSDNFTLPGTDIVVPGFLFWVALVYAAVGTIVTHLIGRPLVRLFFAKQRYEANFRFSLARIREYEEQVALLGGEAAERRQAMSKFDDIIHNYFDIIARQKKLIAFTSFYGQISPIIPYVFSAPFYFLGKVELGVMTQTAGAFGNVNEGLNFFVTYYRSLAEFRAVLDRLTSFDEAIETARELGRTPPRIEAQQTGTGDLRLSNLHLGLPDGRRIVSVDDVTIAAGHSTLLTGPSGSGKSTLLRALAGIWPFGDGRISLPKSAKIVTLPQKPYFPIGTLRAAASYPAPDGSYSDDAIKVALRAAQLPDLAGRLDESDAWSQRLSGGEQQRLAIARALLAKPDWLLLDEATASLDEANEQLLYRALAEQLPNTTLLSIAHHPALRAYHGDVLAMTPNGEGFSPKLEAAPERS